MQMPLKKGFEGRPVEALPVVRNFREVMETRDISLMKKELYEFLTLSCGFIAHYNIHGFRETYSPPKEFAGVFIRHFDRKHVYACGIYGCDEAPYRDTGHTKAEIKKEFYRIADMHVDSIARWADEKQMGERLEVFKRLKREFDESSPGLKVHCEACGNEYEVRVVKEGQDFNDFGIICCLFCGHQKKLY